MISFSVIIVASFIPQRWKDAVCPFAIAKIVNLLFIDNEFGIFLVFIVYGEKFGRHFSNIVVTSSISLRWYDVNCLSLAIHVLHFQTDDFFKTKTCGKQEKEYCRVAINDEGNLTIAIENKQEHRHEDKHHHYLRREFSYSNYEQSYTLPDDVVKDQISAKVEDGILTVTMPKTEPKQKVTKAIEVS